MPLNYLRNQRQIIELREPPVLPLRDSRTEIEIDVKPKETLTLASVIVQCGSTDFNDIRVESVYSHNDDDDDDDDGWLTLSRSKTDSEFDLEMVEYKEARAEYDQWAEDNKTAIADERARLDHVAEEKAKRDTARGIKGATNLQARLRAELEEATQKLEGLQALGERNDTEKEM